MRRSRRKSRGLLPALRRVPAGPVREFCNPDSFCIILAKSAEEYREYTWPSCFRRALDLTTWEVRDMRMYDLIERKDGAVPVLTEEIAYMVRGFVAGDIPDYQMSAMLMAVYFKGMDDREITDLTWRWRIPGTWWICRLLRESRRINTAPAAWGIRQPW